MESRTIQKRLGVMAGTCLAVLASTSSFAHHSGAAQYHLDREITLDGELTLVEVRYPHSTAYMRVVGENGEEEIWYILMERPHAAQLKVGDRIRVMGHPGRGGNPPKTYALTIYRATDALFLDNRERGPERGTRNAIDAILEGTGSQTAGPGGEER